MNKRIKLIRDFDILGSVMEELGYNILSESESELKARQFPFYFRFYKRGDRTNITFHMEKARNPMGIMKKRKKTSQELLAEYHKIIGRYKLKLKTRLR